MKIYPSTSFIANNPIFLHDFEGKSETEVMESFSAIHTDEKIIIASYTYEDYSGSAYVLFTKQGKIYEVTGGHCSCYGLEDQWEPTEVCLPELINRAKNGKGTINEYSGALRKVLGL